MRKFFITSFIIFLATCISNAQGMYVSDFYCATNDLDALLEETSVYEQNGDKCALIKVETTQHGFTFDVGSLGITATKDKPGEIWVYVPHNILGKGLR